MKRRVEYLWINVVMNMEGKIPLGVIGAGYWGRKHVDEYSKLSSCELKWVSDLSQDNLDFCKERYEVPNLTKDYHELLSDPEVAGVSICTNNDYHYSVCKDALNAGKHVLIEKPVTLDSKEAYELVKIAKEKGVVFQVGHIYRFNAALDDIKQKIDEKFFGKIFLMKLQWTHLAPSPDDRDVIFDLAPHAFDILNYLLDEWPQKITCKAGAFRRKEMEEAAYIICEFESGVMAQIEISWLLPGKVRDLTIVGDIHSAVTNCVAQTIQVYESQYDYEVNVDRNNTIESELSHFVECVAGRAKSKNSGLLGAKTVEMIECALRSAREGITVKVEK